MALAYVQPTPAALRRAFVSRLLEDERWLALALFLPTVVILGLFIAYPFMEGVLLAVTNAKVGVPGHFVGTRVSRPCSSSHSACGLRFCSTGISKAKRLRGRSCSCHSLFRPCSRPSPGNGCSIRPSA